ncbi:MAG: anhydro-N-acetylmuramic acid kinase [Bacteroidales bacterium]|nr:anhydro-N-acetylmuramic acid kinase [Bacteroidales bacterium]MBN2757345.1 anhydro-N-acetylmuramic acid kinase [Bacteroidales bacterium]
MPEYNVVGIMSGTSLDGLDIALCNFKLIDNNWQFKILNAKTFEYDEFWKNKLTNASEISAFEFVKLHKEYGNFIAQLINNFLKEIEIKVDLISSHGHTVFHLPELQINFQIGDGAIIAAKTKINTVSDFRTLDIALSGQGAPLVPIGDQLLFNNFDFCLNLGGFANISFNNADNKRVAYDICPVNMVLNEFAKTHNMDFDKDGELGKKGNVLPNLLNQLNNIEYYKKSAPKSLSKEWYISDFKQFINLNKPGFYDNLRTVYEHIAVQISLSFENEIFEKKSIKSVLITGGGTFNNFLIEIIKTKTKAQIFIPEKQIVEYKEALIFAFLGVLRFRNEINSLASVTGAKFDNSSGIINRIN